MVTRSRIRALAILVTVVAGIVSLAAHGRSDLRCKGDCYGSPPLSRYGSLTYEPGHPWTRYADSWQWGAQAALGYLGVIAALIGLGLAATDRRNPMSAVVVSVVAMVAWGAWVVLSPPTS